MIDLLPQAVALIPTFEGMLVLTLGTMPGIGSMVAVGMILPFTLTMSQGPTILRLLAIYACSVYGGSISATLINTPGTPQSIATCFDVYSMAQHGEALVLATIASVAGGLLSAIALILLGLTCIVSVSKGSLIKGLVKSVLIGNGIGILRPPVRILAKESLTD